MYIQFNRFELNITKKDANIMYHQGDCEYDVRSLLPKYKKQLDKIPFDAIISELKEYGEWTIEELTTDKEMTYIRLLWIASGNLIEQSN